MFCAFLMYNYVNYKKQTKTYPWDLWMCVGAQPQMVVESREPAQPVKEDWPFPHPSRSAFLSSQAWPGWRLFSEQ